MHTMRHPLTHIAAALCAITTLTLAAPQPTTAHDLPRERTLLVQIRPDAIDLMVVYLEPPTDSLEFFKTRHDLDRDGEIDSHEATFAVDAWLPRAMQHLTLEWNDHPLERAHRPKLKFETRAHGALASAMLITYDLPDQDTFDPGSLTIHRAAPDPGPTRPDFPTILRFQLTRDLTYDPLPDSLSTDDDASRTSPTRLQPGHSLTLPIHPAPTTTNSN